MKFIHHGNYAKALKQLRADQNNAVSEVFLQPVNLQKAGQLADVVFTLKNNYAKNFGTTDASSNLLTGFNPGYNATILNKLFAQGAQLVATTNLDEFGLGGTGQYSNQGLILNPLNNQYLVGGSSSGSAATFSDFIGFAIGSDTGDSVRLPASNIGKVGFKPSYGAVSRYGLYAYASSLDTVAWFSHNVNDAAVLAQILFGQDKFDLTSLDVPIADVQKRKPQFVAYLNCFAQLNNYVAQAYEKFLNQLRQDPQIHLIEIQPDQVLLRAIKTVYDIISFAEASSNLSNLNGVHFGQRHEGQSWESMFQNTRSAGFGFMVQRRLALGSFYLEKENQQEMFLRSQKIRRLINNWFQDIHNIADVFVYPAAAGIAPLKDAEVEFTDDYMNWILTGANLVGNPSISIKLGSHQNMPFNLAIDSKIYTDEKLLSHALYLEAILGGQND